MRDRGVRRLAFAAAACRRFSPFLTFHSQIFPGSHRSGSPPGCGGGPSGNRAERTTAS
jgi:hypothetical protein